MWERDCMGNVTPLRAKQHNQEYNGSVEAMQIFCMVLASAAILMGACFHETLVFQEISASLNWFVKIVVGFVLFLEYTGTLILLMVCATPSAGKTKRQNVVSGIIFIALAVLIQITLFVGILGSSSAFLKDMIIFLGVSGVSFLLSYLVVK